MNGTHSLPKHIHAGELNRFASRYRLATNFQGLQIDGYSSMSTAAAYSAVMQFFLTYSALEQLDKATKIEKQKRHLNDRWAKYATEPSPRIRRAKRILCFLHEQANNKLKHNLQKFINCESDNTLYVATALRHAIAHGSMSVHSGKTSPQTSIRFCRNLNAMLIQISNQEFAHLLKTLS